MLGDSVKVSPVLMQCPYERFLSYFPSGKWADLNNYTAPIIDTTSASGEGTYIELYASTTFTNIHLKAGKIIPY